MKQNHSFIRVVGIVGLVFVIILGGAAAYLFWPVSSNALASHPNPATSYEDAVQRVTAIQAQEGPGLNSVCKTQLLTHGQKTEQVVILVHGYTHCPDQFKAFAPKVFDQGNNVLIVPLPQHGLANRMNEDQSQLTAVELAAYADQVVDIAQGLGDKVVMMGFSLGGVTTAWAAQNRSDIDRAVVISPPFGFKIVPAAFTVPAMRAYMLLPNSYTWWDPNLKDSLEKEDYFYPRYATHALAQTLRLGFNVISSARQTPFKAGSILVITNPNDEAINQEMVAQITNDWQKQSPQKVSTYQFPASLKLKHDLLSPDPEIDLPALAYPKFYEVLQASGSN